MDIRLQIIVLNRRCNKKLMIDDKACFLNASIVFQFVNYDDGGENFVCFMSLFWYIDIHTTTLIYDL